MNVFKKYVNARKYAGRNGITLLYLHPAFWDLNKEQRDKQARIIPAPHPAKGWSIQKSNGGPLYDIHDHLRDPSDKERN